MEINNNDIIQKIYNDFSTEYKLFSKFVNSGDLWNLCIKTAENTTLLNHIVFCNDVIEIPPVKVFLKSNPEIDKISKGFDKKCVCAFWAFVFKNTLNYTLEQENVIIKTKGIKTATRYYKESHDVKIV